MYLTDILVLNGRAVADFKLKAAFNADGSPKPIVLVGSNGSGKTSLLSVIADALIEIAALGLQGVTPNQGPERQFFRVLGGRSVRLSTAFEIAAARFEHGTDQLFYRSKVGQISPDVLASKMSSAFGTLGDWQVGRDEKAAIGPAEVIKNIFHNGVYVFFPADRFELPYWINLRRLLATLTQTSVLNTIPDSRNQSSSGRHFER